MEYNIEERCNLAVNDLKAIVEEYNKYAQASQEITAKLEELKGIIIAKQAIINELRPFLAKSESVDEKKAE